VYDICDVNEFSNGFAPEHILGFTVSAEMMENYRFGEQIAVGGGGGSCWLAIGIPGYNRRYIGNVQSPNVLEPSRLGLVDDVIVSNRGGVAIYRFNQQSGEFNVHSFVTGYPIINAYFGDVLGFSDNGAMTLVVGAPGENSSQNFQIPTTSAGGTFSIFNYCYCTDSWDLTRKIIPTATSIPANLNMFSHIGGSTQNMSIWVSNPHIVTSAGTIFDHRDVFPTGPGTG
jgi:hypothetical protein